MSGFHGNDDNFHRIKNECYSFIEIDLEGTYHQLMAQNEALDSTLQLVK